MKIPLLTRSVASVLGGALFAFIGIGAASPANAAAAKQLMRCEGRVRAQIADYLFEDAAEIKYQVRCGSRRMALEVLGDHRLLRDGALIRVRGEKVPGKNILRVRADGKDGTSVAMLTAAVVSGAHKALIIRISSLDGSVPCSEVQLNGYMWANSVNVNTSYQVASYGNVSFPPDGDNNGLADVVSVSIAYNTSGLCNYSTWGSAAQSAAAKLVNTGSFQHMMYVLPSNVNCGWAGLASLGGGYSYYHGKNCTWQPELFQHELGHNLGFHHSGTAAGGEYADHSCGMGNPSGPVTFNGSKRVESGWLPSANIASGVGSYMLKNADLAPAAGDLTVIKLTRPSGGSFYVSYRQKGLPQDGGLSATYDQKVLVTRSTGMGSISYLDAILGVGQSFTDSASGLGIMVNSIDTANQSANVTVSGDCILSQPQISISPASQAGIPGSVRTYTVAVSNRDSVFCAATSFTMSSQAPLGWGASLNAASLALAAGSSGSLQLTVTAPLDAAEGAYAAVVSALGADHAEVSGSAGFKVDVTAPNTATSVIAAISKKGNRVKGVNVSCSGASDAGAVQSGISGYKFFRGSTQVCGVGNSCFDPITAAGAYTYKCKAIDGAGNESVLSTASATVTIGSTRK